MKEGGWGESLPHGASSIVEGMFADARERGTRHRLKSLGRIGGTLGRRIVGIELCIGRNGGGRLSVTGRGFGVLLSRLMVDGGCELARIV